MTPRDIEEITGAASLVLENSGDEWRASGAADEATLARIAACVRAVGIEATADVFAAEWARTDPNAVPGQIEARLLRKWLILHGHSIASIDAAIGAISDTVERELTLNEWEYATSYTRRHPMFPAFVRATGLSDGQIDQAFREAAEYA